MRQSEYFVKTNKEASSNEAAINAKLLEQAGFVYKNSAGIYTYLPLGWRVMQKVTQIIREEMNAIGGQEVFMPALHDKRYLEATGRWDVDVVYKVITGEDKEPKYNISWTHEEIAAEIANHNVKSYKDLPFGFYQFQTKFRYEPRAKSGLLRGREFMMKDLYSFHATEDDLFDYYNKVKLAYLKIFERCGVKAYYTLAAGGDFTVSNTHEFQTIAEVGEDVIMVCKKCGTAENIEISKLKAGDKCPNCDGFIEEEKSVEVGNIFPLGTKYSEAFNLKFTDQDGKEKYVVMGSYGIGVGRLMGTVVEVSNDKNGIIWPDSIAPFAVHLVSLGGNNELVSKKADELYQNLQAQGVEVLYDDRREASAGQKFADSDLFGIPYRIVVSEKTLANKGAELKPRNQEQSEHLSFDQVLEKFSSG